MRTSPCFRTAAGCFCAGLLCLAAGCATKSKVQPRDYAFFPSPPDEPRVQFLTSFSSESELGGSGRLSKFVVGEERFRRPIWKPYGIAVAKGKYHVCDTQPKSLVTVDLVKRRIAYLRPEGGSAMKMPINVAVDQGGTRYVTDTVRGQVLIFSRDGGSVGAIGKKDEMKPGGIALTGSRIYVTDISNHCVRVYNRADRAPLFVFPRSTNDVQAKLFSPTNLAIDQKGQVYVSDSGGFAIKIYDAEGNHLRTIGEQGITPGRFALAKGIGVDREGRIFVVDAATAVVQVFDPEGRLLMFFGEPATSGAGSLYLPAGLAIDYENVGLFQKYAAPGYKVEFLILVINQAGPNKVSVFGFVRKG